MKAALLLIDLQHDYLDAQGLEPSAGSIVEGARELLEACRAAGIPVYHVWTSVSREGDDRRMPHWRAQQRWQCVKGTHGHATPEKLRPVDGEQIIEKAYFSAFSSGTLETLLAAEKVEILILAGVHLHACVRETAIQAYERGFQCWIARDATGSDDAVHAAISLRYLECRVARLGWGTEILRAIMGEEIPPQAKARQTETLIAHSTARARLAWRDWTGSQLADRVAAVERLAACVERDGESLAMQTARDTGKPIAFARVEAEKAAVLARSVARHWNDAADHGNGVFTRTRSLGVIGVITPWNNPLLIPLGKIVPALIFGNAVVWKPAPPASRLAERLQTLMLQAGLPADIVSVITGDHQHAAALMADPELDAVSLTGGSLAGYSAQEICARRRIPLQAELGGNNGAIVWPDADLRDAAKQIAAGAFGMAGQRCTANRRAIVHESCREEFVRLVREECVALPWGDPLLAETRVGPLVHRLARDRVAALLERSVRDMDEVFVDRLEPDLQPSSADTNFLGAWYPPSIVRCENPNHEIVQEETFGPVLVVQTARDWGHAMALLNGVRQGLSAALFSSSLRLANVFLHEARAGILKVNRSTADAEAGIPFGGWKHSGIGPPEHGACNREFHTRSQTLYLSGVPGIFIT